MSVTPKPSLSKFKDMQKIFMTRRVEASVLMTEKVKRVTYITKRTSGLLFCSQCCIKKLPNV